MLWVRFPFGFPKGDAKFRRLTRKVEVVNWGILTTGYPLPARLYGGFSLNLQKNIIHDFTTYFVISERRTVIKKINKRLFIIN